MLVWCGALHQFTRQFTVLSGFVGLPHGVVWHIAIDYIVVWLVATSWLASRNLVSAVSPTRATLPKTLALEVQAFLLKQSYCIGKMLCEAIHDIFHAFYRVSQVLLQLLNHALVKFVYAFRKQILKRPKTKILPKAITIVDFVLNFITQFG